MRVEGKSSAYAIVGACYAVAVFVEWTAACALTPLPLRTSALERLLLGLPAASRMP